MFDYCMHIEVEGYRILVSLSNKFKSMSWIEMDINHSIKKCTMQGARRDSMVHFQLNRITEGYEDLVYMEKQQR